MCRNGVRGFYTRNRHLSFYTRNRHIHFYTRKKSCVFLHTKQMYRILHTKWYSEFGFPLSVFKQYIWKFLFAIQSQLPLNDFHIFPFRTSSANWRSISIRSWILSSMGKGQRNLQDRKKWMNYKLCWTRWRHSKAAYVGTRMGVHNKVKRQLYGGKHTFM